MTKKPLGLVIKNGILIAATFLIVAGAAAVLLWLRPTVSVTVQKELVGPEDEALMLVWQGASLDKIKSAVQRSGKRVDHISWLGGSLLYYAVDERRIDVIQWLLEEGADPNGVHYSMVPLAQAIRKEDVVMVDLLIQSGSDPDFDMGYSITPRKNAERLGNPKILSAIPPKTPAKTKSE